MAVTVPVTLCQRSALKKTFDIKTKSHTESISTTDYSNPRTDHLFNVSFASGFKNYKKLSLNNFAIQYAQLQTHQAYDPTYSGFRKYYLRMVSYTPSTGILQFHIHNDYVINATLTLTIACFGGTV